MLHGNYAYCWECRGLLVEMLPPISGPGPGPVLLDRMDPRAEAQLHLNNVLDCNEVLEEPWPIQLVDAGCHCFATAG
jgi:hypothetical protein